MIRRLIATAFASVTLLGGASLSVGTQNALMHIDYMPTRNAATAGNVEQAEHAGHAKFARTQNSRTRTNNLVFNGGNVETAPKAYLVFFGSQWASDPNGEAAYATNFYSGLYGANDTWSTSTTQYCQGISTGSTSCGSNSKKVVHPSSSPLAGVWSDNSTAAPSDPSQTDLANEAIKAAAHFGNTTASSNASVQYIIATAHNNNETGFGTQWCAWHSGTSSQYGTLAFTNLPYIPDAAWSCGAGFVNANNALDGVSIVGGHEYAESVTDQFPSSGWLDRNGAENGDKCAWLSPGTSGGAKNINLVTGTFPVQSLWSNNMNSNNGGCAIKYVSSGQQNG